MTVSIFDSAFRMAQAIERREVTAEALLDQVFDQVDRVNPDLNAVIWQDRDAAIQQARLSDKNTKNGLSHGALHGVPVTVKEAFDLAGSPTTWGIPAWKDNIASKDADVVKRYKDAGAVIYGKTNVPLKLADWQSFNDIYGVTRNPWDKTRTPGGSSGGSAAALASGLSAIEAGSDIGSSIRNPAHYCGVFGLKPTWGLISMQGHLPPGWKADIDIAVTGPMARYAKDLSLAFDILIGPDRFHAPAWETVCREDLRTRLSDFRVAFKDSDAACPIDVGYRAALTEFADRLAMAGAKVDRNQGPELDTEAHFDLYLQLLGAAMSADLPAGYVDGVIQKVKAMASPLVERIMLPRMHGASIAHAEWLNLNNQRKLARLNFDEFFENYDILLMPVAASAAFEHNHAGERFERSLTINGQEQPEMLQLFYAGYSGVVGLPSTVGPIGQVNALPVGYQAVAGYGRDRTALAFTQAVENELGGFVAPF